ncbi:MAG: hypothetical protein EBU66_19575 [Bacteroidetes bacterium]|nr:hypothetical protein [Bacteroidota bacterium]
MTERETNWEEVELMDATHVEISGKVHKITERGGTVERSVDFGWIDILIEENKWANIPQEAFPLLGIKPLIKVKPTPIEFEATFIFYDGNWRPFYTLDNGIAYQNFKKAKFRCVEILEEE